MQQLVVAMVLLCLSQAATAQTLTRHPVAQQALSRDDMTARLEKAAVRTAAAAPKGAARGASVDICWPRDASEYAAVDRHVLVLVSVVTRQAAELPLRRVYASLDGREIELLRLSSQVARVRKGSSTFAMFGSYREDGFYLAPAGAMLASGFLRTDFAVTRTGFNLYTLPGTPPDFISADSSAGSARDAPSVTSADKTAMASAQTSALRAMLRREYSGFAMPTALR